MHANSSLDGLAGLVAVQRLSLDAALQATLDPAAADRGFAAHLEQRVAAADALENPPEALDSSEAGAPTEAADPQAEGDAHLELLLAYL